MVREGKARTIAVYIPRARVFNSHVLFIFHVLEFLTARCSSEAHSNCYVHQFSCEKNSDRFDEKSRIMISTIVCYRHRAVIVVYPLAWTSTAASHISVTIATNWIFKFAQRNLF